jgi:hypothetical protein
MKKWEYKIIENQTNEYFLNELGKEGWELVSLVYVVSGLFMDWQYTFKREIEE